MTPWENFTNQKQWETYLKNLVKTNQRALLKGILIVYENQTKEEKCAGESVEDNGIGFNKYDAIAMSKIAEKIKNGKGLKAKDIAIAKLVMPKYWKQLMVASKRKMELNKATRPSPLVLTIEERDEILRQCLEEGKACSFGICDECPFTNFRSDKDDE